MSQNGTIIPSYMIVQQYPGCSHMTGHCRNNTHGIILISLILTLSDRACSNLRSMKMLQHMNSVLIEHSECIYKGTFSYWLCSGAFLLDNKRYGITQDAIISIYFKYCLYCHICIYDRNSNTCLRYVFGNLFAFCNIYLCICNPLYYTRWTSSETIDPSYKSHNAPLGKRNVQTYAYFCYQMVRCGIWDWCIVGCEQQVCGNRAHSPHRHIGNQKSEIVYSANVQGIHW